MTQSQTRQLGRALMAVSGLQLVLFMIGATRRSYLVLAVPIGIALGLLAGLGFWVGFTMAHTNWDDPADFGVDAAGTDVLEAEGAPPPDTLGD